MILNRISKYHIITLLVILLVASACSSDSNEKLLIEEIVKEYDRFGFEVDSFNVVKGIIKKNQTLADIFLENNLTYAKVTEIFNQSKPVFDFRKIQPDSKYRFYSRLDSSNSVFAFVYEISKIEFIIVQLSDSLKIDLVKREIEITESSISGTINSSLYQTFIDNGKSPVLAGKLADVFAWQIDFYTIQKGDSFIAIYEEEKVREEVIGIGDILSAKFIHKGNEFNAYFFNQNGKYEYFDERGNSLQKAFLKAPLKFKRISSKFSKSRLHPILRTYKPHLGIDYAASVGTPVQAVGDGIILEARYNGAAGNYVKIKHNSVYSSGYMHLSKYAKGIKRGIKVNQGQIIGFVGSTGRSTGPHLDFRFWKNGTLVNYLVHKFPSSKSIAEEFKNDFILKRDSLQIKLNAAIDSSKFNYSGT